MVLNLLLVGIIIVASLALSLMALGFRRNEHGEIEHSIVTSIVVCTIFLIVIGFAYWIGFFWTFLIFFILIPLCMAIFQLALRML